MAKTPLILSVWRRPTRAKQGLRSRPNAAEVLWRWGEALRKTGWGVSYAERRDQALFLAQGIYASERHQIYGLRVNNTLTTPLNARENGLHYSADAPWS
jgi:hypothetical protein